jgi:hypothetical protein
MSEQPDVMEFTGSSTEIRDSEYLASGDFQIPETDDYREEIVTIINVFERRNLVFEGGRKKPRGWTLKFAEKERELLINATNREMLKKLFGFDSLKWRGKKLLLWVDKTVKLKGQPKPGIRIKPVPEARKESKLQVKQDPVPAFRTWLESKGLTEADATERLAGRTLDEATDEDWKALRAWAKDLKPKEAP